MGPQGGASIALCIIASLLLAGYSEACYDAYGYYYDCGYHRPYYRTRWYVSTWAYIGYSIVALIFICVILCIILAAVFTPRREPKPQTTMTVVQTPYDAPPAPPPPVVVQQTGDVPAPPPPVVLPQPPPTPSTPTKNSPMPPAQPQGAVPAGQPQIVYAVTDANGQVKYYSQPPPNTPPPPPPQQNQPQIVYV